MVLPRNLLLHCVVYIGKQLNTTSAFSPCGCQATPAHVVYSTRPCDSLVLRWQRWRMHYNITIYPDLRWMLKAAHSSVLLVQQSGLVWGNILRQIV